MLLQVLRQRPCGRTIKHALNGHIAVNLGGKVEALTEERAIENQINLPVSEAEERRAPISLRRVAIERNSHDTSRAELFRILFCPIYRRRKPNRAKPARLFPPVVDDVRDDGLARHQFVKIAFDIFALARANPGEVKTGGEKAR